MHDYSGHVAYDVGVPAKSGDIADELGLHAFECSNIGSAFVQSLSALNLTPSGRQSTQFLARYTRGLHVFGLGKDGSQFLAASTGRS
jgi:hypothetical protein